MSIRTGGKRLRNAGIGAAAGGTVGAVWGCADGYFGCAFGAAAVGGVLAVAGAGIGALFPGYDTIYRVPRK